MKITQDVRHYAARLNEQQDGMTAKSTEFLDQGAQLYVASDDG